MHAIGLFCKHKSFLCVLLGAAKLVLLSAKSGFKTVVHNPLNILSVSVLREMIPVFLSYVELHVGLGPGAGVDWLSGLCDLHH